MARNCWVSEVGKILLLDSLVAVNIGFMVLVPGSSSVIVSGYV